MVGSWFLYLTLGLIMLVYYITSIIIFNKLKKHNIHEKTLNCATHFLKGWSGSRLCTLTFKFYIFFKVSTNTESHKIVL